MMSTAWEDDEDIPEQSDVEAGFDTSDQTSKPNYNTPKNVALIQYDGVLVRPDIDTVSGFESCSMVASTYPSPYNSPRASSLLNKQMQSNNTNVDSERDTQPGFTLDSHDPSEYADQK